MTITPCGDDTNAWAFWAVHSLWSDYELADAIDMIVQLADAAPDEEHDGALIFLGAGPLEDADKAKGLPTTTDEP